MTSCEPKKRGKFIVLEGIDRCGKTSICRHLIQKIKTSHSSKSLTATSIQFPNRKSVTGSIIDQYLTSRVQLNPQTIHLLFSANRWEMKEEIEELLCGEGSVVISDRYYFSGISYTAAKGVDLEWCCGPDNGLPVPDLVVFVDVRPERAAEREGFGTEKYEDVGYLTKVYDIMKSVVVECENGVVIDGDRCIDEIVDDIYKRIMAMF